MSTLSKIFIFLLFISSCVKQDNSDCPDPDDDVDLRVYFTYNTPSSTYSSSGLELIDIDKIDLFIFDKDGYFDTLRSETRTIFDDSYYMPIELEPGDYNFVAWANLRDCYTHQPEAPDKGITHMNELFLDIVKDETDTIWDNPHILYYGTEKERIVKGEKNESVTVEIVRITHVINVAIKGIQEAEEDIDVIISDTMGGLDFDNLLTARSSSVHYACNCALDDANTFYASLSILKLEKTRNPILKLYSRPKDEIIFEEELMPLILKIEEYGGTVDFTRNFEYDVIIEFYNGGASHIIIINGWKVYESDNQISG